MIRSRSCIPLKMNREEPAEAGLELFDCVANEDDVCQYISSQIPAHWHRELETFYLISGEVRVGVGDQAYDLHSGDGCFINTGVLHSFTALTAAPCRFRSFVFDAAIVAGAPGSLFDTRYVRPFLSEGAAFVLFPGESAAFSTAFDAAFSACETEGRGYEFAVRGALSQILLLAEGSGAAQQRFSVQQEERLKAMLAWIDAHLESDICVDDLARAAHVCPRVCQRLFRQYLHCRPMEYCMQKRVMAAAWMLAATDESVTDVAIKYAFSSSSHFARQFRLATGCTPSEYREKTRRRE